jgi:DNA polymerase III gamma/tau subunit
MSSRQMLSLSLRPRSLDDLVGQSDLVYRIRKHMESKRVPGAWMFQGASGAGKTTTARILALSLQCPHQKVFGSFCKECQKRKSQFDIIEVNSAENSGVDETEAVITGTFYNPKPPSKYRVYIWDEAQKLSAASQSVLLKYFEDSPRTTVWIICTTEPGKILKTLRRRCLTYTIPELDDENVTRLVRRAIKFAESKEHSRPLVKALLEANQRSPGFIVMAVEKYLAGEKPRKAAQVGLDSSVDTLRLCRAVTSGDWETTREIMLAATAEDARVIRASLGGYLKGIIVRSSGDSIADRAEKAIRELTALPMFEEGLQLSATVATLYSLCKRFER